MTQTRSDRLHKMAEQLRHEAHLANIRLANSERGLSWASEASYTRDELDAFRVEVSRAREALSDIHRRQGRIVAALDMHTSGYPDMALVMVDDPDGMRIIERRDPDGEGDDDSHWYHLGTGVGPMTFSDAIGADEGNPQGYEFWRLYTSNEVDVMLDNAAII